MNDPIELTDDEWAAAKTAFSQWKCRRELQTLNYNDGIRMVLDAINRVRAGDPAGTIRRTDSGIIALLTNNSAALPWNAFSAHGHPLGQWSNLQVSEWPVIYSPEVV